MGLTINEEKTKQKKMTNTKDSQKALKITAEDETTYELEKLKKFKYLGVVITDKNEMEEEIEERIMKGSINLGRLNKFLTSKNVTRQTKKQVYKTVIRPTVLYACETSTLTKKWEQRLEIGERKILRKIYGGIKEQEQ